MSGPAIDTAAMAVAHAHLVVSEGPRSPLFERVHRIALRSSASMLDKRRRRSSAPATIGFFAPFIGMIGAV